jgi:hypothetical protein
MAPYDVASNISQALGPDAGSGGRGRECGGGATHRLRAQDGATAGGRGGGARVTCWGAGSARDIERDASASTRKHQAFDPPPMNDVGMFRNVIMAKIVCRRMSARKASLSRNPTPETPAVGARTRLMYRVEFMSSSVMSFLSFQFRGGPGQSLEPPHTRGRVYLSPFVSSSFYWPYAEPLLFSRMILTVCS